MTTMNMIMLINIDTRSSGMRRNNPRSHVRHTGEIVGNSGIAGRKGGAGVPQRINARISALEYFPGRVYGKHLAGARVLNVTWRSFHTADHGPLRHEPRGGGEGRDDPNTNRRPRPHRARRYGQLRRRRPRPHLHRRGHVGPQVRTYCVGTCAAIGSLTKACKASWGQGFRYVQRVIEQCKQTGVCTNGSSLGPTQGGASACHSPKFYCAKLFARG